MSYRARFKDDIVASSVLFLVAMPLCLGIALASNAPLFSGILAGIIGGIVVGMLSPSHVSVSGPAAGMIAVVLGGAYELGSFNALLTALILAGILQIIIGKCRAGFVADFVPGNVVQGLLCAIGILIVIKQLPFAFGYIATPDVLHALETAQVNVDWAGLANLTKHISIGALLISVLSFAVLMGWDKLKSSAIRTIPAPVIVVVLGVLVNIVFEHFFPVLHLNNKEHLVAIPQIESFTHLKNLFHYPDLTALYNYKVYFYAFLIAIVASIETLLNLEAAEKIDTQKRYCSRNKELMAQGLGNIVSGCLGGLPITSVIVRSSVNVRSGNKTKKSAILHGAWLMLAVLFIPTWINKIPLASLAAILIFVGFKLSSIKVFKTMYQRGMENFLPFIVTVVAIIASNLLAGILCGILVSAFLVMKYNSRPSFQEKLELYPSGEVLRLILPQQATFLNKAALISALRTLPNGAQVILDGNHTHYLDHDIRDVIDEFSVNLSKEKNISLRMEGFKEHHKVNKRTDFMNVTTKKVQMRLAPSEVLQLLKEGNRRFSQDTPLHRDTASLVANTAEGQHPVAAVISCIDSRVPVELIFDAGVGDLFVGRVAGNIVNQDLVASMEYACGVSGAKVIVVLGHTDCGAIKAACTDEKRGNLPFLLHKIKPAIHAVKQHAPISDNAEFLLKVTQENVKRSQEQLIERSDMLKALIERKKLLIIGAIYDIKSAEVRFSHLDASSLSLTRDVTSNMESNEEEILAV